MSASNVNKPRPTKRYLVTLSNTNRVHIVKTGREHPLHSDIEKKLSLLLNSSSSISVIDIREQFPLTSTFTKKMGK